jgi:hypothetical protein
MKNEELFTLEFNVRQQLFHFNYGDHEKNTMGWVTICDYCSEDEFKELEKVINNKPYKWLSISKIQDCLAESKNNLLKNIEQNNVFLTSGR